MEGEGRGDRWESRQVWRGRGKKGEGGGESRRSVTFFGFQLLQHPCLLALFAVGLRLHVLSQISWKGMRTDSGSAGGQVPGQAWSSWRQCLAGRLWLLRPFEAVLAAGAGQRLACPSAWVLWLGCTATATT